MTHGIVSSIDFCAVWHSVEAQAGSRYEAAAALESSYDQDCSPGIGSELEVQV